MEELANEFTIERIGKSGTRFDIQKARWFNEQYLRAKPDAELAGYLLKALEEHNITCTPEKAEKIAGLMKERVSFPQEFWREAAYFFVAPTEYSEKVASKKWNSQAVAVFTDFRNELSSLSDFNADTVKELLTSILERHGMKLGMVMQALRLAVTGAEAGPDLMQIIEVIGREETESRIDAAINALSHYATA